MDLSIQLYTLEEETEKDFIGTLEKVAEIGYKGVEFAGYGGIPASDMKKHFDRLGLKATGSHINLSRLTENLDEEISYNLEIGNKYLICPHKKYQNREDYIQTAKLLNDIGEKCFRKGLVFCYHNHAHEFQIFDGEYGMDIIYGGTKPEYLKAQIDTCWVHFAGIDPAAYIRKYAGRCPLIHLKDRTDNKKIEFTEVGAGIIDIVSIIKAGKESGTEWFAVERDEGRLPAMESVRISFENIKRMNLL